MTQLHFVWDIILDAFKKQEDGKAFKLFWDRVVDRKLLELPDWPRLDDTKLINCKSRIVFLQERFGPSEAFGLQAVPKGPRVLPLITRHDRGYL
jgi:hypothetical protein